VLAPASHTSTPFRVTQAYPHNAQSLKESRHEEIFPKARKAKVDMSALGEQLAARKQPISGQQDAPA